MRSGRFSDNIRPMLRSRLPGTLLLAGLLCAGSALLPHAAFGKPQVHTVYAGQRLGSIAKRYNVTIEALCAANNIDRKAAIRPGQKLLIPDRHWRPGDPLPDHDDPKQALAKNSPPAASHAAKPAARGADSASANKPERPRLHVVQKGHTLGAISGRYGITVSAICTANDLDRKKALDVGQTLVIPAKSDVDGRYARKLRIEGRLDEPDASNGSSTSGTRSWKAYEKKPWRRGYIKIRRYGRSWTGYVIGPKGEVLGHASSKINFVMGSVENGPDVDPRLIRLIAQVSDTFGGRELRIVSGYRTKSFVAASKHKEGRAIDFSIPGVPNEALRDYLRTLGDVGVGYYPNSTFVHLDVRGYSAHWVDYAGPGEAPKKSPHAPARRGQPIESDDAPEGWTGHDAAPDDHEDAAGESGDPTTETSAGAADGGPAAERGPAPSTGTAPAQINDAPAGLPDPDSR